MGQEPVTVPNSTDRRKVNVTSDPREVESSVGRPLERSGREGKNMIQETIAEIEARIKKAGSLSDEKQRELLNLLSTLKTEVSEFSKVDIEHAQSITGFTKVSVHEAMRKKKKPQLLRLSLQGLSTSVEGFEESHPKLAESVNSICQTLSNMGI